LLVAPLNEKRARVNDNEGADRPLENTLSHKESTQTEPTLLLNQKIKGQTLVNGMQDYLTRDNINRNDIILTNKEVKTDY
jgi:hypothetical protein